MTSERKKILIIDDDSDLQVLLKKRLNANGFDCTSAFSVKEALRNIQEEDFNLIILDLGFRDSNGILFLKCLKDWDFNQNEKPPVIVLSGFDDKEIIDHAFDLGATQFLIKPYAPDSLLEVIHTYIH